MWIRTSGPACRTHALLSEVNQQCVAASAMQVIKAMLYDAGALMHAPGPEGLPAAAPYGWTLPARGP